MATMHATMKIRSTLLRPSELLVESTMMEPINSIQPSGWPDRTAQMHDE